jgi:hypothetical protein
MGCYVTKLIVLIVYCSVAFGGGPTEFTLAQVRRGRFGLIFLAEQINDLFVQFLNHVVRLLFCP